MLPHILLSAMTVLYCIALTSLLGAVGDEVYEPGKYFVIELQNGEVCYGVKPKKQQSEYVFKVNRKLRVFRPDEVKRIREELEFEWKQRQEKEHEQSSQVVLPDGTVQNVSPSALSERAKQMAREYAAQTVRQEIPLPEVQPVQPQKTERPSPGFFALWGWHILIVLAGLATAGVLVKAVLLRKPASA